VLQTRPKAKLGSWPMAQAAINMEVRESMRRETTAKGPDFMVLDHQKGGGREEIRSEVQQVVARRRENLADFPLDAFSSIRALLVLVINAGYRSLNNDASCVNVPGYLICNSRKVHASRHALLGCHRSSALPLNSRSTRTGSLPHHASTVSIQGRMSSPSKRV
jgi:hypothetical protein